MDLLSYELLMFISVRSSIKSIFELEVVAADTISSGDLFQCSTKLSKKIFCYIQSSSLLVLLETVCSQICSLLGFWNSRLETILSLPVSNLYVSMRSPLYLNRCNE